MRPQIHRRLRSALAAGALLASACAPTAGAPVATRAAAPPREYALRQLGAADRAIDAKDYATALSELSTALDSGRLNALERALAIRSKGYVYTQQQRFPEAIDAYEKVLALQSLPQAEADTCTQNLGQLYNATQQYADALRVLEPLAKRPETPSPEIEMALANAYWGLRDGTKALPLMKSAVSRRPDAPEKWLRALVTLYLDQKQYENAAELLNAGLAAGRIEPTPQVLDVLVLAWSRAGHPEKAEPVLRDVAARSADGRADLCLGKLLIQEKRFPAAIEALGRAIAKGGLDEPALAELLLGIARFESGDYAAARAPLEKAEADAKTRTEAREYLDAIAQKSGGAPR